MSLPDTVPKFVARPGTPQWYAARKTGIGASRAAAACGMSKYGSPLTVYEELLGESEEQIENKHTRFGKFMEPAIIAMYRDELDDDDIGVEYPLAMYRHPEWKFMLATPDACEVDLRGGSHHVGLEIKTIDPMYAKAIDLVELGIEEALPEYVIQAQQQMAVMTWRSVKIVMLLGKELRIWEIYRDEETIALIKECEEDLWNRVQNRNPPPVTSHLDLTAFRKKLNVAGSVVPLSNANSADWEQYEELGQQIKALNEQRDLLKAKVLAEIGDAPAGLLPNGTHMIRRKIIDKEAYEVRAQSVLDVRKVKYDGSPIVVPQQETRAAS